MVLTQRYLEESQFRTACAHEKPWSITEENNQNEAKKFKRRTYDDEQKKTRSKTKPPDKSKPKGHVLSKRPSTPF
jgi:hypothetical protein